MKVLAMFSVVFFLCGAEVKRDRESLIIVVVSDFNCKACHSDIIKIYSDLKDEMKIDLSVYLVTHEKLTNNINKSIRELAMMYRLKEKYIITTTPDKFLNDYPQCSDGLDRSPFLLLKREDSFQVISQKSLSEVEERPSVHEQIIKFYK